LAEVKQDIAHGPCPIINVKWSYLLNQFMGHGK